METMFDTLLQLPLFQGLCHKDFTSILDKVKLEFIKHKAEETIINSGDTCDRLHFLLKGEIAMITKPKEETFTVIERIEAPYLIEPQSLFGMSTSYRSSYIAQAEVHTVSISKTWVLNELFNYEIFRLNYMNIISNRAQTLNLQLWDKPASNLREKVSQFLLLHCEKPQGEKKFRIKMEDLAAYLDETRLNISKTLNMLQEEGKIELSRKEIFIADAQKLLIE